MRGVAVSLVAVVFVAGCSVAGPSPSAMNQGFITAGDSPIGMAIGA